MWNIVIKALLILSLSFSLVNAEFMKQDKKYHAIAGGVLYVGCVVVGKALDFKYMSLNYCYIYTLGAAVGKEVVDAYSSGHVSDFDDITATMVIPTATYVIYKW